MGQTQPSGGSGAPLLEWRGIWLYRELLPSCRDAQTYRAPGMSVTTHSSTGDATSLLCKDWRALHSAGLSKTWPAYVVRWAAHLLTTALPCTSSSFKHGQAAGAQLWVGRVTCTCKGAGQAWR